MNDQVMPVTKITGDAAAELDHLRVGFRRPDWVMRPEGKRAPLYPLSRPGNYQGGDGLAHRQRARSLYAAGKHLPQGAANPETSGRGGSRKGLCLEFRE